MIFMRAGHGLKGQGQSAINPQGPPLIPEQAVPGCPVLGTRPTTREIMGDGRGRPRSRIMQRQQDADRVPVDSNLDPADSNLPPVNRNLPPVNRNLLPSNRKSPSRRPELCSNRPDPCSSALGPCSSPPEPCSSPPEPCSSAWDSGSSGLHQGLGGAGTHLRFTGTLIKGSATYLQCTRSLFGDTSVESEGPRTVHGRARDACNILRQPIPSCRIARPQEALDHRLLMKPPPGCRGVFHWPHPPRPALALILA